MNSSNIVVRRMMVAAGIVVASLAGSQRAEAVYVNAVNALGPVHYWRFSETSGPTASDSVNGKNGTYVNSPLPAQPGPPHSQFPGFLPDNVSIGFQATDADAVTFADPDQLGPSETFSSVTGVSELSMVLWFRLDEAGSDTTRQILAGYQKSTGSRYIFLTTRESTGNLKFYLQDKDGDQIIVEPYSGMTDSNWHQVAMTWNGGSLRTYLDGGSEMTFSDVSVTGKLFTPEGFIAARDINGSNSLDGRIDELTLFDYVLSGTEVQDLYESAFIGQIPEPSGLVLCAMGVAALASRRRPRRRLG